MFLSVHKGMGNRLFRRIHLQRLHLLPDNEMPDFVRRNIGNQLEQVQPAARKSTEYTDEERANFPHLVEYQDGHLLEWNDPQPKIERWADFRKIEE